MVFWSLSCYKELKLSTNPFTGHTLHGLLIQIQNICLQSPGMHRKQNFETFDFYFSLSLLSSLFALLASFFFSLAGHLVGFTLVGRVFKKAFRILWLGEKKGGWAWNKIFMEIYRSILHGFLPFSLVSLSDWIVLILVWFERSLYSAQVSGQSWPWLLKLMMSWGVERTWIHTGGYRQFRGEWVKGRSWNKMGWS